MLIFPSGYQFFNDWRFIVTYRSIKLKSVYAWVQSRFGMVFLQLYYSFSQNWSNLIEPEWIKKNITRKWRQTIKFKSTNRPKRVTVFYGNLFQWEKKGIFLRFAVNDGMVLHCKRWNGSHSFTVNDGIRR